MRGQYCHLDGEPHAAQHLARVHDPQELVLRRGLVHHYHQNKVRKKCEILSWASKTGHGTNDS